MNVGSGCRANLRSHALLCSPAAELPLPLLGRCLLQCPLSGVEVVFPWPRVRAPARVMCTCLCVLYIVKDPWGLLAKCQVSGYTHFCWLSRREAWAVFVLGSLALSMLIFWYTWQNAFFSMFPVALHACHSLLFPVVLCSSQSEL